MPREYPVRREEITRAPIHPGVILAEDVLPVLRMTVSEAARHLRVTRQTLPRNAARSVITPEMALRLGKFCGNGAELWLRMQEQHDLWQAQLKLKGEIEKIPTVDAAWPRQCTAERRARSCPVEYAQIRTSGRKTAIKDPRWPRLFHSRRGSRR